MARRKRPESEELTARIDGFSQTYYLAQTSVVPRHLDDEAQLEIAATIVAVSSRHARFLNTPIEISLLCARKFVRDEPDATRERPFMLDMHLRKDRCSCMAYIPSDAFWALTEG